MSYKIKNILFITSRADFGGGPEHIFRLLDHLADEYRIFIASPDDYPYYDKYRSIIGKGRMITISHRKFKIGELLKLRKFCKQHSIDLIHSHGRGAGVYSRLLKVISFRKSIHTFHGIHLEAYSGFRKWLFTLIEKLLCFISNACVAVSQGEYETVLEKKLTKKKKLHLIENGVHIPDATVFSNIARTDPLRIMTITRFDYAKNPDLLIKIFTMLNEMQNEYDFYLDVIGEGENAEYYSAALADVGLRDRATFHGAHSQLDEFYLNSFCYLSTSRWEGMSLAVLEAMSYGLPVIATNVRGNNNLIEHSKNGYLYDISKPEEAVKYIVHAADDKEKYHELSTAARDLVSSRFSLERCAKGLKALYEKIM